MGLDVRIESVTVPILRQLLLRPRLSEAIFRFDSWGNPFSVEANADPYALLPTLREEGPVVYKPMYQQWFVSGYEEARTVLSSDAVEVSTQREVVLAVRPHGSNSTWPGWPRPTEDAFRFSKPIWSTVFVPT